MAEQDKCQDGWPHIVTRADYEQFQKAFENGTKGFAIICGVNRYWHVWVCKEEECPSYEDVSASWEGEPESGPDCDECGQEMALDDADEEGDPSAGFSGSSSCELCNRTLRGERYHMALTNPGDSKICHRDGCSDCLYYAEYGRLDDSTMMKIE